LELGNFLVVISTAGTEKEIDEGAEHLARAIAIVGVIAFFELLRRASRVKLKGKPRPKGEEAPPPEQSEPPPKKSELPPKKKPAADAKTPNPAIDLSLPEHPELQGTLERIAKGEKFPHRNDGSVFGNREGLLPGQPRGYDREYVHLTPGASGPGGQRVVVGQGGEVYCTSDHYKTFMRVK